MHSILEKSLIVLSHSNINTEANTVWELNHWTSIHCSEFVMREKKLNVQMDNSDG